MAERYGSLAGTVNKKFATKEHGEKYEKYIIVCSVANPDPGCGAFLIPGFGIRDGKKIRIREMNIPYHFSESLETVFIAKIT
jgi:hypothetical protein